MLEIFWSEIIFWPLVFSFFFFSFLSEDISDKWEAENVDEHVDVCLTEAEFKADREEELTRGVS